MLLRLPLTFRSIIAIATGWLVSVSVSVTADIFTAGFAGQVLGDNK
jgi:hypothetical protein